MDKKPDIAYIRKYVNGELSPHEMFEIEKAAHEDEMLMDIILGLENEKNQYAEPQTIHALQQQIKDRSAKQTKTGTIFPFWRIGIAASFLFVLGIGVYIWKNQGANDQLVAEPTVEQDNVIAHIGEATDELEIPSTPSVRTDSPKTGVPSDRLAYHAPQETKTRTQKAQPTTTEVQTAQPISLDTEELHIDTINLMAHATVSRKAVSPSTISINPEKKEGPGEHIRIRGVSSIASNNVSSNLDGIPLDSIRSITTGIVIDKGTQHPIAGATIRDTKTNHTVQTDSTGQFILVSTEEKTDIQVHVLGFESLTLPSNGSMRIALSPDEQMLSEVVVTGYGRAVKKIKTEPLMGNRAYGRLLDKQAKDSKLGKGTVTLVFFIDVHGRPTNIRIKNSAGTARDRKAIELIQHGPDWKQGNDGREVEWKVSF